MSFQSLPLALSLAMLLFSGALLAEGDKTTLGIITGNRVNVRGRPLSTAELCGQLEKGDKVEILEKKAVPIVGTHTEEWFRIVLPEKFTVWLQTSFLGENGTIQTKTKGRAGPSLMWPILCSFEKGDAVTVKTNHLDWTGIVPPRSSSAWISGLYVSNVAQRVETP